jgi:MoaA/NifB/PqqE/SkfB family radical SAM enzyme
MVGADNREFRTMAALMDGHQQVARGCWNVTTNRNGYAGLDGASSGGAGAIAANRNASTLVVGDLVVQEDFCNLACDYCRGNVIEGRSGERRARLSVKEGRRLLDRIKSCANPLVLKLSGGELSCLGGECLPLCIQASATFPRVQILTNGVDFRPHWIDELNARANVFFQFSLDGHTLPMNAHRFSRRSVLTRIIDAMKRASALNPIEVNAVVTRDNAAGLVEFSSFLADVVPRATLYPFPVRGRPDLFPEAAPLERLLDAVQFSPAMRSVLPPLGYLRSLVDFIRAGVRQRRCYVPLFVRGFFDTGDVQMCPCEDLGSVGDLWSGYNEDRLQGAAIKKFCVASDIDPKCRQCFTHYEVLNLAFEFHELIPVSPPVPLFVGLEGAISSLMVETRNRVDAANCR